MSNRTINQEDEIDYHINKIDNLQNSECNILIKDLLSIAKEFNFKIYVGANKYFKYVIHHPFDYDKWMFTNRSFNIYFNHCKTYIKIETDKSKFTTMFYLYRHDGGGRIYSSVFGTACPMFFRYLFKLYCTDHNRFNALLSKIETSYFNIQDSEGDKDIGLYYPIFGERINAGVEINNDAFDLLSLLYGYGSYFFNKDWFMSALKERNILSYNYTTHYLIRKLVPENDTIKYWDKLIKGVVQQIDIEEQNINKQVYPYWVPLSLLKNINKQGLKPSVIKFLDIMYDNMMSDTTYHWAYKNYIKEKRTRDDINSTKFVNYCMCNGNLASLMPYASLLEMIWNNAVIKR